MYFVKAVTKPPPLLAGAATDKAMCAAVWLRRKPSGDLCSIRQHKKPRP